MKIIVTSFKRSHACTATLNPAVGLQHCSRPPLIHTSSRDSWTLTGKSGPSLVGVSAPFSWVLVHKVLFVPPRLFPQPCGRSVIKSH